MLAVRFEHAGACEALLAETLDHGGEGLVAASAGGVDAFLLGERQLHAPRSYLSYFFEPYEIAIPVHGHAVAADADAHALTRELYAHAAERWVADGFFAHGVRVAAGDTGLDEAWLSLGFGRKVTCGWRPIEAADAQRRDAREVTVRRVGTNEVDVVTRLMHVNAQHHARTPMFWPYLRETVAAGRELAATLLADPTNGAVVGWRDGRPVAMCTFMAPSFVSPLLVPEDATYLFHGVVERDLRGGGVGGVVFDGAMRWAYGAGHRHCLLHFGSANLSGAAFWLGLGFTPVEHTMLRRIDSRITWAGARGED
jgi:predicted GNAT superfamily acetyltransferase